MSIRVFVCDSGEEFSIARLNGWFGGDGLVIHPGELNYILCAREGIRKREWV